jgi:hypothetical protein
MKEERGALAPLFYWLITAGLKMLILKLSLLVLF